MRQESILGGTQPGAVEHDTVRNGAVQEGKLRRFERVGEEERSCL